MPAKHDVLNFTPALALVALALALTGCHEQSATQQMPPPVVTVAPVTQQEVTEWNEFTGHTDAVESVEVRPRVSGHIDQVCFQAGQLVKKGDVLFQIDPRWYQAEYDRHAAEVEQAKVRLANAERDAGRAGKLLKNDAISSESADSTESQYQEAKAALQAAQAVAESAKLDLDYTQVRSPINGRVSRALLTTGNYVSGTAGAASLLTSVVSVDPVYVYADMDENAYLQFNKFTSANGGIDSGNLKVPVELALADEDGFPHRGVVESFDNRVDANTGTILLRAVFSNPDGRLVPGMYARIRVPASDRHPAVLVDETAIGTDQAQKYVLAVGKDNNVEYRKVQLGPEIDGKRIVRSGLQPGEKIIVNGIQRARPGQPVNPQEAVADVSTPKDATANR
ncbi:MAG: efflux RND transporter periplasmic adaptor subunit [Chthoniobacteraceae bacterium]